MPNMSNYALMAALVGAVALYAAWREYAGDNRRDAVLIAAFGAGVMFAAAWLVQPDFT